MPASISIVNALEINQQFFEIVQLVRQSRNNALKAVNTELVDLYWNVGEYIAIRIEDSTWGQSVVTELANFISKNEPDLKGFSDKNLWMMKQFYETYHENAIVSSVMTQLEKDDIRKSLLAKISCS